MLPLFVTLAALGVYVSTLAPTVTAEDSGELIGAAWHFGIPHPPGYPLWTILCGAFLRIITVGEIAWRANLFSAICTATSAGVFSVALRELSIRPAAAASAALVWALSRWAWMQAVITEVYGLNALVTSLLLYCAVRWRQTQSHRLLLAASLIFGLGMSNHHSVALVALALIVWIVAEAPRLLLRWRVALASLSLFVCGLFPYAYLPLRARTEPAINWGNPSTGIAFWNHVTRHQYGAIGPTKPTEPRTFTRTVHQLAYVVCSVADDLTIPLAVAAGVGLLVMLGCDRSAFGMVVLWMLTAAVLFVVLSNFDLDRVSRFAMRVFLIPVTMAAAIPLSYLLNELLIRARAACKQVRSTTSGPNVRLGTPRLLFAATAAALVAAPVWQAVAHWRGCDYSDYYLARDHAQNLLNCMMPKAMLFPSGDHSTFPLAYLILVEGIREDIVIADLYGYVRPSLYSDRPSHSKESPTTWAIRSARRPVYYTTKTSPPVANASFVPAGMLYHLLPHAVPFNNAALLDQCHYRNHDSGRATVDDLGASYINVDYYFFRGLHALTRNDVAHADRQFEAAAVYGAGIKEVLNNIGSALAEYNYSARAEPYFQQAAALDRHYVLPRWNLYRVAAAQEDWALARRCLEDVIVADPDDYRAYGQLGFILAERLNDLSAAQRAWQQSLRLEPDQPQIAARLDILESEGQ